MTPHEHLEAGLAALASAADDFEHDSLSEHGAARLALANGHFNAIRAIADTFAFLPPRHVLGAALGEVAP